MNNKKVKVLIGTPTGFCSGVRRAIAIVKREAQKASGSTSVCTLGPIVHNAEVVNELKKIKVKTIKMEELKPQKSKKPVVVIRSHGCAPQIITKIKKLGYEVVDATCPYVRRVQNYALQLKSAGYFTIVIGDKNHPEVKGIIGYAKPRALVFCRLSTVNCPPGVRIGIIGQTTVPFRYFRDSINSFNIGDYQEIRIFNTLCKESLNRQKTCKKIADIVNLMIIVGSRASANTGSLLELTKESKTKVYLVENKSELQKKWFKNLPRIGVIAGASTPTNTVLEVVKEIKKFTTRECNVNG